VPLLAPVVQKQASVAKDEREVGRPVRAVQNELIQKYQMIERVLISSFDEAMLDDFRKIVGGLSSHVAAKGPGPELRGARFVPARSSFERESRSSTGGTE
jgi:hypothetical protein